MFSWEHVNSADVGIILHRLSATEYSKYFSVLTPVIVMPSIAKHRYLFVIAGGSLKTLRFKKFLKSTFIHAFPS